MIEKNFFKTVADNEIYIKISGAANTKPADILSLHGAGPYDSQLIDYLIPPLTDAGGVVARFDFSGHGQSKGALQNSSLNQRLEEALALKPFLYAPLTLLMGTSMGGHIAVRLLKYIKVQRLLLFCPAIYADAAENIGFGDGFTQEIRKPASFFNSSAWEDLDHFEGDLLIVMGREDPIIPDGVQDRLKELCNKKENRRYLEIPDAPHNLHIWSQKEDKRRENMTKLVQGFYKNGAGP